MSTLVPGEVVAGRVRTEDMVFAHPENRMHCPRQSQRDPKQVSGISKTTRSGMRANRMKSLVLVRVSTPSQLLLLTYNMLVYPYLSNPC